MKVLVTGATGFLGREIINECLVEGFEVIGIGRKKIETENSKFKFLEIDITNEAQIESLKNLLNLDVIIHCAGLAHQFEKISREDFFKVNVKGTENLVNLAKRLNIKHFVLISSVSVYGIAKHSFDQLNFQEEANCLPIGDYAESKLEAEIVAENISKEINLTILRPATIIGENDKGNVSRLIQSIDNNRFIQIGKCENKKTLVDKNYVARVCIEVIKNKVFGIYNVANKPLKMSDIVETIYQSLGKKRLRLNIPETIAIKLAKIVDFLLQKNFSETINKWIEEEVYSQNKLEIALSNLPQIKIKETLIQEVKYYINHK